MPSERQQWFAFGMRPSTFGIGSAVLLAVALFSASPSAPDAASLPPVVLAADEWAATPDVQLSGAASDVLPCRAELLERLGVPAWHKRGWRGRGLKVAVLDSGFRGYKAHLGAALPRRVKARSFRFDGDLEAKDSQHGILCAEVIHVLAPDADLLFANWEPEHPDQFLAAVRWARDEGARILSCSIIMPTWSDCEGHGRIHEELARLLRSTDGTDDALFFASAGNTAQRHWSGPFQDGGDGHHVWKIEERETRRENVIHPWGSERVSVELCCPSEAVYELIVSDLETETVVGRSISKEAAGAASAVVAFVPEQNHDYQARVRRVRGPAGRFHLVVLGGRLRHTSRPGSIAFPGDGTEVIAVGAVDAAGQRLPYSSCGMKRGGTKPDFVATVPFPSSWRACPFAGTSAAAPQASALAALLWSRHTDWSAARIHAALKDAVRPCSANSSAWETGRGLLCLPSLQE
ncbi:MAG TPA: S8 family serine peptidase [Gemmataceae bacterium]|nr:S8 family serine peptidase [Gemmataceae bacterium]